MSAVEKARERKATQAVAAWNETHAMGTAVEYRSYPGAEPRLTKTCSPAWVMGGHSAVVLVEDVSGCVALFALTVIR